MWRGGRVSSTCVRSDYKQCLQKESSLLLQTNPSTTHLWGFTFFSVWKKQYVYIYFWVCLCSHSCTHVLVRLCVRMCMHARVCVCECMFVSAYVKVFHHCVYFCHLGSAIFIKTEICDTSIHLLG